MNDYNTNIKRRLESKSQDISAEVNEIKDEKVVEIHEKFDNKFQRVIDNTEVLNEDNKEGNQSNEIVVEDPYLSMEVNLSHDEGKSLERVKLKMRVVDKIQWVLQIQILCQIQDIKKLNFQID